MRIGIGYDIHKLVENRPLIIGGITIPYSKGLLGHSDADVLIHAIIDSILGAMNYGDIGMLFPDTDKKYKDIPSTILLEECKKIIDFKSYKITNIDTVIVAQAPKLSGYYEKMKEKISSILKISISDISIKSKTNEEIDSIGEKNAIAAYAICLIENK